MIISFVTAVFLYKNIEVENYDTAQKMKFSVKDFFSKYESLMKNFIFCAVRVNYEQIKIILRIIYLSEYQ